MIIVPLNIFHYPYSTPLLSNLTTSGQLTYKDYLEILNKINKNENHYVFVCEINDIPAGMITLIIEQKLIHSGKCVGHIEDLVVGPEFLRKGVAKTLIDQCVNLCKENNCYKVILDCKKELIPFYNKSNFEEQGVCMRRSLD